MIKFSQAEIIRFFEKHPNEIFTKTEVYNGKGKIKGLKHLTNPTSFYRCFNKITPYLNSDSERKIFWYEK